MAISIKETMKKEHQKIDEIISKFRKSDKDGRDAQYLFDKLIWSIKEHFFMEEKLIFDIYDLGLDDHDNEELIGQHQTMLEILDLMNTKNIKETAEDLQNLEDNLIAHAKLEEDIFYEELDEKMSEDEKDELFKRAKEFLK